MKNPARSRSACIARLSSRSSGSGRGDRARVTALAAGRSWRPRRPAVARLRGGGTQQRSRHEQHHDHSRDTSSDHGFPSVLVTAPQGGICRPTGGKLRGDAPRERVACHATGRHGNHSSCTRGREVGSYDVKNPRRAWRKLLARPGAVTVPAPRSRGMENHPIARSADLGRPAFRRA